MAVHIVKGDPLAGVPNKGQIAAKIGLLMDETASFSDRRDAAGWLRGANTVTRRNPKLKKAADYIDRILKTYKYKEDTTN